MGEKTEKEENSRQTQTYVDNDRDRDRPEFNGREVYLSDRLARKMIHDIHG